MFNLGLAVVSFTRRLKAWNIPDLVIKNGRIALWHRFVIFCFSGDFRWGNCEAQSQTSSGSAVERLIWSWESGRPNLSTFVVSRSNWFHSTDAASTIDIFESPIRSWCHCSGSGNSTVLESLSEFEGQGWHVAVSFLSFLQACERTVSISSCTYKKLFEPIL